MRLIVMVMLILTALVLSGCAGTLRLPQCRGPWTPVNPPIEIEDES